ncbi:Tetratricopeptide repeat protein 13 [Tetrabaena socialis]|uniref:Tetratricopeptide repeat protein 13 n=1 Tax=Tetrabaena socialis TaxID=47790 RepID=A0A2J7ZXP0_9CHLO|nr:Tetratricopeptide repeat protein 13 [Tetrabaena socialis]|eukprot:PNH05026.1 Tetratricopeptide repeat protein 13 [Tetrabaena socialis]
MGGGLNFLNKKTWHPARPQNLEEVWKREQKALAEEKKAEELRKQLAEERKQSEYVQMAMDTGHLRKTERLDWMYGSGLQAQQDAEKRREEMLTGKTEIVVAPEQRMQETNRAEQVAQLPSLNATAAPASQNENWLRLNNDPLFAIKRQQQEQLAKLKENPVKMMELLKSLTQAKEKEAEKKEKKKEKKGKKDKKRKRDRGGGSSEEEGDGGARKRSRSPPRHDLRGPDMPPGPRPHEGRDHHPQQRGPPEGAEQRGWGQGSGGGGGHGDGRGQHDRDGPGRGGGGGEYERERPGYGGPEPRGREAPSHGGGREQHEREGPGRGGREQYEREGRGREARGPYDRDGPGHGGRGQHDREVPGQGGGRGEFERERPVRRGPEQDDRLASGRGGGRGEYEREGPGGGGRGHDGRDGRDYGRDADTGRRGDQYGPGPGPGQSQRDEPERHAPRDDGRRERRDGPEGRDAQREARGGGDRGDGARGPREAPQGWGDEQAAREGWERGRSGGGGGGGSGGRGRSSSPGGRHDGGGGAPREAREEARELPGGDRYGLKHSSAAPEQLLRADHSSRAAETRTRLEEARRAREEEERAKVGQRHVRKDYKTGTMTEEEKQRKLAEMMGNADEHDAHRRRRLDAAEAVEAAEGQQRLVSHTDAGRGGDAFRDAASKDVFSKLQGASLESRVNSRRHFSRVYGATMAFEFVSAVADQQWGPAGKVLDGAINACASDDKQALAQLLVNRGYCNQKLQLYRKALKDYDGALEALPRFALALYRKGQVLAAQKKLEEARTAWNEALQSCNERSDMQLVLDIHSALRDPSGAKVGPEASAARGTQQQHYAGGRALFGLQVLTVTLMALVLAGQHQLLQKAGFGAVAAAPPAGKVDAAAAASTANGWVAGQPPATSNGQAPGSTPPAASPASSSHYTAAPSASRGGPASTSSSQPRGAAPAWSPAAPVRPPAQQPPPAAGGSGRGGSVSASSSGPSRRGGSGGGGGGNGDGGGGSCDVEEVDCVARQQAARADRGAAASSSAPGGGASADVQTMLNNSMAIQLAVTQINAGNIAEAEAILDGVIASSPRELGARVARGTALKEEGRTKEAERVLLRALTLDPPDQPSVHVLRVLAQMKQQKGEHAAAIKLLDRALPLAEAKDEQAATEALGKRGPYQASVLQRVRVIEVLYLRAICHHALGATREAIRDYDECLGHIPSRGGLANATEEARQFQFLSFYQKDIALYFYHALDRRAQDFCPDSELPAVFKELWCKKGPPSAELISHYPPQPPLPLSPPPLPPPPDAERLRPLTVLADQLGVLLQNNHQGFLPNLRQQRAAGFAAIELGQAVREVVAARRAGRQTWVRSEGSSGQAGSAGRHLFGWRDAMDIVVKWRQLSEPNDQVVWVDLLTRREFEQGFGSHTPMFSGQTKCVRYYMNFGRALGLQREVLLREGHAFDASNRTIPVGSDAQREAIRAARTAEDMYQVILQDSWVVVPIHSVAREERTMEGTRLTLVRVPNQPDAYEFSIRTPVTPPRWKDFDAELEAAFEGILQAFADEDMPALAQRILTYCYYWYNFMPLARGTAAVDWEAILAQHPHQFAQSLGPWLFPPAARGGAADADANGSAPGAGSASKPLTFPAMESLPPLAEVLATIRHRFIALNGEAMKRFA